MATLTDRAIKAKISGAVKSKRTSWMLESLGRGNGSLALKVTQNSANWYYRYKNNGRSDYWPIGPYGDHWTLKRARDAAQVLAVERSALQDGNLRAYRERQEVAERARIESQRQADERVRLQIESAQRYTLKSLVDVYVAYLTDRGKTSSRDAQNILHKHVIAAWPEITAAPARDLTRLQVTTMLRKIVEAGKGRTAGKVRSYLSAAYTLALRAEGDPETPSTLLSFGIDHNPVANTASLCRFNKVRNRVLRDSELRAYWDRLEAQNGILADFARVQLLLAGQRFEQLLRARIVDFDQEAGQLMLRDPKGRRSNPRLHVVPLPPLGKEIMHKLAVRAQAHNTEWLFTSEGKMPIHPSTISKFISDIANGMLANNEVSERFIPADIRRTVETRLASMGVSRDTRGQIQSHGLSGIQVRHYDRHDYMKEKQTAINAWAEWLQEKQGDKVTPIRTKKMDKA